MLTLSSFRFFTTPLHSRTPPFLRRTHNGKPESVVVGQITYVGFWHEGDENWIWKLRIELDTSCLEEREANNGLGQCNLHAQAVYFLQ